MRALRHLSSLFLLPLALASVACAPVPCSRLLLANQAVEKQGGDCWADPPEKSAQQVDDCNAEAARVCSDADLEQLTLLESCVAKLDLCEGNGLTKLGWVADVLTECVNKPLSAMSADCRSTVQAITQQ